MDSEKGFIMTGGVYRKYITLFLTGHRFYGNSSHTLVAPLLLLRHCSYPYPSPFLLLPPCSRRRLHSYHLSFSLYIRFERRWEYGQGMEMDQWIDRIATWQRRSRWRA